MSNKSDHYVRDLHASIVDVVLDLNVVADVAKRSRHGVAQHRIPHVPDVRRFIRIDAGMFHDNFVAELCHATGCRTFRSDIRTRQRRGLQPLRNRSFFYLAAFLPKCCAIEKRI